MGHASRVITKWLLAALRYSHYDENHDWIYVLRLCFILLHLEDVLIGADDGLKNFKNVKFNRFQNSTAYVKFNLIAAIWTPTFS